ncbi:hypothetical protein C7974DRAFT_371549 [Boeremia exigua]|uniref:uncharacterized protein n=1 Tax=Boeremia exigua TaxID=749465 RepID=UPI001E8D2421|nr:uncharacterized protein C7974DRAFT_371549 [Boeremia exigua]KAH6644427.1 hypothetical protein C7974DRAFT_371549 [Boeremia exigua]
MPEPHADNGPSESDIIMNPTVPPANPKQAYVSTNNFSYESVSQTEQDDRQSQTLTADGSIPKTMDREARTSTERAMLIRRPFHWWFSMPMDFLLALTPLLILGKIIFSNLEGLRILTRPVIAGLCLSLNKQEISKYGEDIKAITLLSPTIFPIIYAAILGKMLRRVALFKAERTATLGTIERLVGCQSLFSTFERQFAFRRVDLLGFSLLVAWLLSPVGGQSSLRLLATEPLLVPVNSTVKYFPIEGYARQTHLYNKDIAETAWPLFAPLYMTALLTSRQYLNLPMDQFGNIKIPDLFQLKSYSSSAPTDAWTEIKEGSTPEYIFIIGIPIAGLPETGNTSFTMSSHYWSTECGPLEPLTEYVNYTMQHTPSLSLVSNSSSENDANNSTQFKYQTRWITSQGHQRLKNGTLGRSCAVKAMRRLPSNSETMFNSFESTAILFMTISANLPGADQGLQQEDSSSSELVEHWMMDPELSTFRWDRSTDRSGVEQRWVNVAELPTEKMSARLQVAINTYWQSALGSTIMMGNLTTQRVEQLEATGFNYTWNTTELLGIRQDGEQYACNIWFAVITIVISLLLFAVASLVLGVFTRAPDTLGFVSTSARDNPYITTQVPSHLDGLEAARALQHVRVRIGDVNRSGDVGHVAFASMDAEPERVSRKRLTIIIENSVYFNSLERCNWLEQISVKTDPEASMRAPLSLNPFSTKSSIFEFGLSTFPDHSFARRSRSETSLATTPQMVIVPMHSTNAVVAKAQIE